MQDREWKALSNNASKLCQGTEKDGVGKFLYKLWPEVSYAQLSSQLGAIFYQAGVWEWNEERRGMEFMLLSENWQKKTIEYYRDSLNLGSEAAFLDNFLEAEEKEKPGKQQKQQKQEGQIETVREVEQMILSAFLRD